MVDDNFSATSFRFADGSIANMTYCTVGSKTWAVNEWSIRTGRGRNDRRLQTAHHRRRSAAHHSKWFADKGYAEQMTGFIEGIRRGRAPEVTVLDGARATIGCLRMLESAPESLSLRD